MPNMSYCRFHNTLNDLRECKYYMKNDGLSDSDAKDRERLIKLCCSIAEDYGNIHAECK